MSRKGSFQLELYAFHTILFDKNELGTFAKSLSLTVREGVGAAAEIVGVVKLATNSLEDLRVSGTARPVADVVRMSEDLSIRRRK